MFIVMKKQTLAAVRRLTLRQPTPILSGLRSAAPGFQRALPGTGWLTASLSSSEARNATKFHRRFKP
jgi:hypothetical protein